MSKRIEISDKIQILITRAAETRNAAEAMQYAQAAANSANAARVLMETLSLYGDQTSEAVTEAVRSGTMTPNEARAGAGLPPLRDATVRIEFDESIQAFVVVCGVWAVERFTQEALDAIRLRPARPGEDRWIDLPRLALRDKILA